MFSNAGPGNELSRKIYYNLIAVYLEVCLMNFHLKLSDKVFFWIQAFVRVDKSRSVEYSIIIKSRQNRIFL